MINRLIIFLQFMDLSNADHGHHSSGNGNQHSHRPLIAPQERRVQPPVCEQSLDLSAPQSRKNELQQDAVYPQQPDVKEPIRGDEVQPKKLSEQESRQHLYQAERHYHHNSDHRGDMRSPSPGHGNMASSPSPEHNDDDLPDIPMDIDLKPSSTDCDLSPAAGQSRPHIIECT
jgi:hypothetical protein